MAAGRLEPGGGMSAGLGARVVLSDCCSLRLAADAPVDEIGLVAGEGSCGGRAGSGGTGAGDLPLGAASSARTAEGCGGEAALLLSAERYGEPEREDMDTSDDCIERSVLGEHVTEAGAEGGAETGGGAAAGAGVGVDTGARCGVSMR